MRPSPPKAPGLLSRLGVGDLVWGFAALCAGVGAMGALVFIDRLDKLAGADPATEGRAAMEQSATVSLEDETSEPFDVLTWIPGVDRLLGDGGGKPECLNSDCDR